jgi:hypothetical protein
MLTDQQIYDMSLRKLQSFQNPFHTLTIEVGSFLIITRRELDDKLKFVVRRTKANRDFPLTFAPSRKNRKRGQRLEAESFEELITILKEHRIYKRFLLEFEKWWLLQC